MSAKKKTSKPSRAKLTLDSPQNLKVSGDDTVAIDSVARLTANSLVASRVSHKRSAVDRLDDPPPCDPETSLVERVSNAIERELSKIEAIIGVSHVPPVLRTEAESRARTGVAGAHLERSDAAARTGTQRRRGEDESRR